MKQTKILRENVIASATLILLLGVGLYFGIRDWKLMNQVEKVADVDRNGITSVVEWKSVYDSVGRDAPADLTKRVERDYDPYHQEDRHHPAEDLSRSDMRDYLMNNQ